MNSEIMINKIEMKVIQENNFLFEIVLMQLKKCTQ